MERPRTPKLNAQILAEASTWFVEISEAEVSAAARDEFNLWLRTSPEHVRAYLQISALWDDSLTLAKVNRSTTQALLDRARKDIGVVALPPGVRADKAARSSNRALERQPRLYRVALVAGALLAIAGSGFWTQWRQAMYTTDVGEVRTVALSDGSTMELNARSSVQVQLGRRERDVYLLAGQAYFQVAKDAARPFVVHSGAAQVRAVGTEFEVYRRAKDIVVTVIEGRVAVVAPPSAASDSPSTLASLAATQSSADAPAGLLEPNRPAMLLSEGEQVTLAPQASPHLTHANLASATAWMQPRLVFTSTPLTEVIEQYNRYHQRQIVILGPGLSTFHISGAFSAADSDSLVAFLRTQPNMVVREKDTEIDISTR